LGKIEAPDRATGRFLGRVVEPIPLEGGCQLL
jgi:hypothetical protein